MSSRTYSSYLKLDELLGLQQPMSDGPEHDEMLFIVIHQVYELWFKVLLHEMDFLKTRFLANDTPHALHTLKRILTILKTLVSQLDILETMTPLHFLSFRGRLESASGFQSFQFREIEFSLGLKNGAMMAHYPPESEVRRRLEARFAAPSVWDAFLRYLAANGYPVPARDGGPAPADGATPSGGASSAGTRASRGIEPSPAVQALLVTIYRDDATIAQVCERLLDLDEGMQEWRYRHVKMVERTIGTKTGTGGSTGAAYLHTTLSTPVFPDLWAVRAAF